MKARRDGRIVSVAVIIAVGVNGVGRREVLGMAIGHRTVGEHADVLPEDIRRRCLTGLANALL